MIDTSFIGAGLAPSVAAVGSVQAASNAIQLDKGAAEANLRRERGVKIAKALAKCLEGAIDSPVRC